MNITKNLLITLPLTPAKFTTKNPVVVSKNAAVISMSAGGGMGGSFWKEYIVDFDEQKFLCSGHCSTGLIWVTLFNGNKKLINLKNVVDVTPCAIIRASVKHQNNNFPDNYRDMYYITNGEPVSFVNEYTSRCDVNEIIISPFHTDTFKA